MAAVAYARLRHEVKRQTTDDRSQSTVRGQLYKLELAQNALGGWCASNLTDPPLPQQLAQAVGGGLTPPSALGT